MIEFPRDSQNTIPTSSVKIVGLGGAGANMLDRVALDGLDGAEMLALNTDIRTLSGSVAGERIQLGRNLTKGLGTGGDPELGNQAVMEAEAEIRSSLKGRKIVFICVGLGGGTGSGAAPIVARIAREEGAFVVMFATMPFVFEGRRRREQAETALNELAVLSNALVTFDNSRMGELVLAKQGIHEAFAAADRMISESIKAVIRLVVRPGIINIGLDDLMSALRTTRSRCLFGSGIARGKDRAQKALRNALSSPLLDQGALLKDADTVLVHLCGGEDLTLFEIELLMESLGKYVPDKAHVLFGAAVDPTMDDQLSITLVSSLPEHRLRMTSRPPEDAATTGALEPSMGFAASELRREAERIDEPLDEKRPEPEAEPEAGWQEIEVDEVGEEEIQAEIESEPEPEPAPEREVRIVKDKKPGPAVAEWTVVPPADEPSYFAEPEPEPEGLFEEARFEEDEPVVFKEIEPEERKSSEPLPPFAESGFDFKPAGKALPRKNKVSSAKDDFARPSDQEDEIFGSDLEEPEPVKPKGPEPAEDAAPRKGKGPKDQTELSFEGGPRGRFEGGSPSMFEGEDLDVPAFLRKKRG